MAAHDRAVYRGRVLIAGIALIVTSWMLYSLDFSGQVRGPFGLQLFFFQSWAAFFFACGAFTATSDSISREKRDGTLGLLFLTHLKGRDVILGKLIAGISVFVSGAVATLPILALPILLGGIRLSQSLFLLITLLNTMFLSASAGLFASSISVQKQKSGSLAVFIMVFFCGLIPLTVLSLRKLGYIEPAYLLEFLSPLLPQQLASGALLGPQIGYFWTSIALLFSISCALLAAASFITPRAWQQRAKEPIVKRLTERYAAWSIRTIRSRSPLGRALLDRNAYEWLAARHLSAATKAWTFIIAMLLLAAALIANFIRHNDPSAVLITVCVPAIYILQLNLKVRIGGHAADRFSSEREAGALELLLCTPLSIRDMTVGEHRALRRHYLLPALVVAALLFVSLGLSMGGVDRLGQLFTTEGDPTFRRCAFLIVAAAAYFVIIDSLALAWAGVWCGLTCRTQHARSNAMFLVLAVPFLTFIGSLPAIAQSATIRASVQDAGFVVSFLLVMAFITACDLGIIVLARRWLFGNARELLTDPAIQTRRDQPFFAFMSRRPAAAVNRQKKERAEFSQARSRA